MFEQFVKLDKQSKKSKGLSRKKVIERRYYLMYWLSSLYVTIEGIENLPLDKELLSRPLDIPEIAYYLPQMLADVDDYRDSLRLLRNATFHFQKTAEKHLQFFDSSIKLLWARGIHEAIGRLFSDYRVRCAVVCAIAGRKDEIDMKPRRNHPSRNLSFLA